MEREAKLGLGLALVVGLLISLVLYLAPGILPSALGGRSTSEEVVGVQEIPPPQQAALLLQEHGQPPDE